MVHASAVIFTHTGNPKEVLQIGSAELGPIGDDQVLLKTLVSSLNPSDISTIDGAYATIPNKTTLFSKEPAAVVGNEGIFEVMEVGKAVKSGLKVGDWVVPKIKAFGTWRTHVIANEDEVQFCPKLPGIAVSTAALLMVNPPTAYQLLKDFVKLEKNDWIIQNGANSSVGRAVIQLAKVWGYKTINVVRERPDLKELKAELTELGADAVVTDKEIESADFNSALAKITGSEKSPIRLGLECVGGSNGSALLRSLAFQGTLVVYGSMTKTPIQVGPGSMIFNDVTIRGYWLTTKIAEDRVRYAEIYKEVLGLLATGKFKEPPVEKHVFKVNGTTEEQHSAAISAVKKQIDGFSNKKQVLVYE